MNPWRHSRISAHKFGGKPEDYDFIHEWLDQTKALHASMRHRSLLHNSFGCFLAAQCLGNNFVNSAGKTVSVRAVCEQHIIDDLGFIPSVDDYFKHMKIATWMGGMPQKHEYRKMKGNAVTGLLKTEVKSLSEALLYCKNSNSTLKYKNESVQIEFAHGNEILTAEGFDEIDAVNNAIQLKKKLN